MDPSPQVTGHADGNRAKAKSAEDQVQPVCESMILAGYRCAIRAHEERKSCDAFRASQIYGIDRRHATTHTQSAREPATGAHVTPQTAPKRPTCGGAQEYDDESIYTHGSPCIRLTP